MESTGRGKVPDACGNTDVPSGIERLENLGFFLQYTIVSREVVTKPIDLQDGKEGSQSTDYKRGMIRPTKVPQGSPSCFDKLLK